MNYIDKPTNLKVELNLTQSLVNITWDAVEGALQYQIWKKSEGNTYGMLTKTLGTSYVDIDITAETTYFYYIRAIGENNSFTVSYNEKFQAFESFYDFHPSIYINKGFKLLSTEPEINELHEHFVGDYNKFYGTSYPTDVTIQSNPQQGDCIFNNLIFKSEVSHNGIDMSKETLNSIRCWNEYQDSTEKPLILNKNIARYFRAWKLNIPREIKDGKPTLDKIRGHWAKVYLKFDNPNNRKLTLHDILMSYTAYPN